jgi:hypothetical protein
MWGGTMGRYSSLFFIATAMVVGASVDAHAEPVWIQVRESMVRAKPAFYSPGVLRVTYGEQLERLATEGGWVRVQSKSGQGYVPLASVSEDRIVLAARDITKIHADAGDVVLAGKGFSREVEQQYRKTDRRARYDLVDRVEREARISSKAVASFATSGDLQ